VAAHVPRPAGSCRTCSSSNLVSLDDGTRATAPGFGLIANRCTQLQLLDLSDLYIPLPATPLSRLTSLTSLSVWGSGLADGVALANAVCMLPDLKHLSLYGPQPEEVRVQLTQLKQLTYLYCSRMFFVPTELRCGVRRMLGVVSVYCMVTIPNQMLAALVCSASTRSGGTAWRKYPSDARCIQPGQNHGSMGLCMSDLVR
jgi:hypothetical protein